ncbi:transcription factor bHLH96-like [Ananas comosus]|uniref:Transcription factor bHLH96-like n=1 Tax=Ananas comosus TaxID=4615 RepID=A0A6P5EHA6_ANACO|nr:transcription factor bHLH96-like [Ananas comosus]
MALEAVVFPHGLLGYTMKELCSMGGGGGGGGGCSHGELGWFEEEEEKGVLLGYLEEGGGGDEQSGKRKWDVNWVDTSCSSMVGVFEEWDNVNSLSPPPEPAGGRRKRRRMKSIKNKEEVENQRMTHIAVERNRRKQMNEYLAVLRSIMPPSYVQRGDQASIIGGAINFVKELEQLLQSLEAQKRSNEQHSESAPFAEFFTFPQYSSYTARSPNATAAMVANESAAAAEEAKGSAAAADIEVTMVESHANLKVLAKRRPKQLLKLVVGLQNLRLTTLHLNVTTLDRMVLYSFSLKVEDDCQLSSVDDIAAAVHHIVGKVEEEAAML